MSETPVLSVRNLAKRYGGVVALDDMNLQVKRGAIHAVVGENGAGKSTLMKALAGVVRPDSGAIFIDGGEVAVDSPGAARALGIGIVYQELSLFPQRSVLANLFVNREPKRFGFVSRRAMEERSRDLLDRLGLRVDVHAPVGSLNIGERQLVELCRVLLEEPRLLILDEPNSALNKRETDRLFEVLRQLRSHVTMIYVSHRLEEVFAISDSVTITRNGRDVLTKDRTDLTIPEVIEGMIGRPREALFPGRIEPDAGRASSQIVVEGLSGGKLRDVDFTARSGEIVGLAGLEGSGVSNLLKILFGAIEARAGEVVFPDGRGLPRSPTEAARRGVCLVPADRRRDGLMLEKSLYFNLDAVTVGARRGGPLWYSVRRARERARGQISRLLIKARSPDSLARELSGGNQQKVVIGKWLETAPRVFLLDDPTRGVDVGAKREIYGLIRQMSADGGIVLFCSTELPELIGLCDRVLVIYQGRMVGELSGREIQSGAVLHLVNTGEMPRSARADA